MIDERKLIEELKESGLIADNNYGHAMIDFIRKMPKVGEWIPCSERLPEEGEEVLISTKTSDKIYFGMYTKRYGFSMREGFICGQDFMWLNTAIAWQPLPEPYKENADD